MKYGLIVVVLALAACGATYVRYESLHPCDWLEQDMAADQGMPRLIAKARIQAEFLLQGITEPSAYQCLSGWWKVRAERTLGKS